MSHSHRSAHAQPRNRPRIRPGMALLFGLVALITAGVPAGIAAASPPPTASAQPCLGTWNDDQPDQATMRNIAVLSCPPDGDGCASSPLPLPLHIPQIGNIVFAAAATGTVAGRTDQGCTWRFAVTTDSLELSPPGQFCSTTPSARPTPSPAGRSRSSGTTSGRPSSASATSQPATW